MSKTEVSNLKQWNKHIVVTYELDEVFTGEVDKKSND